MSALDALKPVLAQWTTRYRRSPLPAFLAWWRSELIGCLPEKWRAWLQDRREVWLASIDGQQLVLQRQGQPEPIASFDLSADTDSLRADLQRLLGRGPTPDRLTILTLPQADVLLRRLPFPAAVEQNLRQVLSFEMDRQTPFRAEQVHFDFHADLDDSGRQLQVDLALVPRPVLDNLLERARGLGLELDGVDVLAAAELPQRKGFNFLPETMRSRRSNPQRRLNLILGAASVILLFLVMQQSLANRAQSLDTLRERVEEARSQAHAVVALRGQLNTAVEGAGYLNEKKRDAPSVLRVLGDLSARLPDDTWLERLTFRQGNVEMVGQSGEATKLISLLQDSGTLASPAFAGQISPDARTRKERFNLNTRYEFRPDVPLLPQPSEAVEAAEAPAANDANADDLDSDIAIKTGQAAQGSDADTDAADPAVTDDSPASDDAGADGDADTDAGVDNGNDEEGA
ncbi:MAG: PilN domain-containing protein [Xanthomonadales bacterium]|nr:PilN domain-containing protein [Xanthomonadales bacterium]